jgi:hypothetical protein
VLWALFLGGLIWLGFVVVGAGSSYLTIQELIDNAAQQVMGRRRAQSAVGNPSSVEEFAAELRFAIVQATRRTDLRFDERQLSVQPVPSGVRVSLHWTYPILTRGDETYLAIPMSVEKLVPR